MENNSNDNELTEVKPLSHEDCTNVSFVDGCILEQDQYKILWTTSWFTLPTAITAYYNNYYFSSALSTCVLLTSLNYWRKPVRGFSRNLDMAATYFSITYHFFRAKNSQYAYIHYPLVLIGLSCYPIGNYYYKKKQYWKSTYLHGSLHFIANLSYTILFSGKMDPFRYFCLC
jgi:hypothetical protein